MLWTEWLQQAIESSDMYPPPLRVAYTRALCLAALLRVLNLRPLFSTCIVAGEGHYDEVPVLCDAVEVCPRQAKGYVLQDVEDVGAVGALGHDKCRGQDLVHSQKHLTVQPNIEVRGHSGGRQFQGPARDVLGQAHGGELRDGQLSHRTFAIKARDGFASPVEPGHRSKHIRERPKENTPRVSSRALSTNNQCVL